MFGDISFVLDQLVPELLLEISPFDAGLRQPIYRVYYKMEAVQIVKNGHVEGRRDRAFFFVATDVQVSVVGAAVSKAVN